VFTVFSLREFDKRGGAQVENVLNCLEIASICWSEAFSM
jgi:hypothetical protein